LAEVQSEISTVKADIDRVEADIDRVQAAIDRVEGKLEQENLSEIDVAYWREEKKQLREEKKLWIEKEKLLREKENQLREEKKQGRPPLYPQTATNKDMELDRKLSMILDSMSLDRATPRYSAAHVGRLEKDRLQSEGLFKKFVGKDGEESVLSADQVAELATASNEHQVVAYLTPHFEDLVRSIETVNYSVFNSEEYKWIETNPETSVYNEKPDLIICDPAITKAKPPFKITDDPVLQQMRTETFKYGVLSHWKLRDFIGITCEAKLKIDNKGFGEVINYGAHLCFGKHGSQTTRLLLFDTTMFWLVHVVKGTVGSVETCKWLDPGSKNLLRDFIRQPALPKLLLEARQGLRLTVQSDSFLGAGAFGFVFRAVREDDGSMLALKLALGEGESVVRLETEADSMRKASEKCPHEAMGVEKEGFVKYHNGAVLLMSRIGEGYWKLNPQDIVDSLRTLHKNHIIHGDARLDNVVCVDGKPCWVDFMDSRFFLGPFGMQVELEALVHSVREKFQYIAE